MVAHSSWAPTQLAILIELEACGRLAARTGIARLREVLGALYYAAILTGQTPGLQPNAPGDLPPGTFLVGPSTSAALSADLLRGEGLKRLDLRSLAAGGFADFDSAIATGWGTFARARIATGLAWLQRGIDSVSPLDSVLALGVALESVIGDTTSRDVMTILTRRLPFLLLPRGPALERLDVIERTKTFYEYRSRVAHGRLSREDETRGDFVEHRREFATFVARTIAAFIERVEEDRWDDERMMQRWFELAYVA